MHVGGQDLGDGQSQKDKKINLNEEKNI